MAALLQALSRFTCVPLPIRKMLLAQFLLNMVNSGFMLILNIHLRKQGYQDPAIAFITSYRFLGVLALSTPMGLLIRSRPLRPFFLASAIVTPLSSIWVLLAIQAKNIPWISVGVLLWGVGLMGMAVCALPWIMRIAKEEHLSEALALNFASWPAAMLVCGLLISGLGHLGSTSLLGWTVAWDEHHILLVLTFLSLGAIPLVRRLPTISRAELLARNPDRQRRLLDYDWGRLGRAILPVLLIAIGAGLTIPFINLFFFSVFGLGSEEFSLLGSASAVLVLIASLGTPSIKRRFGFGPGILLSQSLAIGMLVVLALTELQAGRPWALGLAAFCFVVRQPLMNMAQPLSSELTMKYIGPRNQELMAAISSSIWSGSWFLSAKIFEFLRELRLPYWEIFLVTAVLYGVGVALYVPLIRAYHRMIEEEQATGV